MTNRPDRWAGWLSAVGCCYRLVGDTVPPLSPPLTGLLILTALSLVVLGYLPIENKYLHDRQWTPRWVYGSDMNRVPIWHAILEKVANSPGDISRPGKGMLVLLALGLIVQQMVVHLHCSSFALKKSASTPARAAASELLSGILFTLLLQSSLHVHMSTFELCAFVSTIVLAYFVQVMLLFMLPHSLSLGESALVSQGFVLLITLPLLMGGDANVVADDTQWKISIFLQVAAISCIPVILIMSVIKVTRTTAAFYLLIVSIVVMYSGPLLIYLMDDNPLLWLVHFVTKNTTRIYLISYWVMCTIIAVLLVYINGQRLQLGVKPAPLNHRIQRRQDMAGHNARHPNKAERPESNNSQPHSTRSGLTRRRIQQTAGVCDSPPDDVSAVRSTGEADEDDAGTHEQRCNSMKIQTATINIRKHFHVFAIAVFLPGYMADRQLLLLAASCSVIVFVMFEVMRKADIWPLGGILERYLKLFVDSRDSGAVILTHLYLLIGCTLPLWLHPTSQPGGLPLSLLSGILSLGIGDTMASLVGTKFGYHHWPGSKKTVEGSLAAFIMQVLAIELLLAFGVVNDVSQWTVLTGVVFTCLMEAFTTQIDNIILPLFMYIMFVHL